MIRLIFIFFLYSSCLSQIVLVHGSFSQNAAWYRPGGDFFESLRAQAAGLQQRLTSFAWSGIPDSNHIKSAGVDLAYYLLSLTDTQPLVIIGHSHGGNVINCASQSLYKRYMDVVQTFSFNEQHGIVMNFPSMINNFDLTSTRLQSFFSVVKPVVDCVVLLGTPVDTVRFWPHMGVINTLFLLYSLGDNVQTVLGSYDRTYSFDKRKIQLNTLLKRYNSHSWYAPSHSELHSSLVAQSLFSVINNQGHKITGTSARLCIEECLIRKDDK